MTALTGGNLLPAGQELSTRYNEIQLPEFQRFYYGDPLIVVNGTKDPVRVFFVRGR